ncbi:MAG: recombination protein RecR, partial [Spirochaetia bacterium]|nr:recombination protein RecR [Spirochaetia bacterium]
FPNLKFSRLAVDIPAGTGLEFIDADTLKKSIQNRYSL